MDIVERLRRYGQPDKRGSGHPQNAVCREAADEIERLRAALLPISDALNRTAYRFVDGTEQHGGIGHVRGKRIILSEAAVERVDAATKEQS